MEVLYNSTRGGENGVSASAAILKGLASDGGLYVPERIPVLDTDIDKLAGMSYQETAYAVMKQFLTDFTEEELKYCISHAYDSKFDTEEIVPLVKAEGVYFLELFHGKTIAFKDMALSILPYLMTAAAKKNHVDNEIVILTATSGDTGKAAMAGFSDVPGTKIIVFYPKNGVSRVQELQMVTQKGDNTFVVGINGNFDDAQTGVKNIFNDRTFAAELDKLGYQLSSANSINIGRLVPQIVYYVYAYAKLYANREIEKGEKVNVTVPTGNFGNILAAWFAKQMGIPFDRLICASNDNKVLYDFFESGVYDKNRDFILTTSPSMDILVSSNLERLLYLSCGRDAAKTKEMMQRLYNGGSYEISDEMKKFMSDFWGGYADMKENADEIRKIFEDTGYLIDPHTGVAAAVYEKYKKKVAKAGTVGREDAGEKNVAKTIIASTASPYKFSRSVMEAISGTKDESDEFELIDEMERRSGVPVPAAIEEIRDVEIRHHCSCEAGEMMGVVREVLGSRI